MALSTRVLHLVLVVLVSGIMATYASRFKLVAYWGQNGVHNKNIHPKQKEASLSHFCQNSKYDVIVLCFMHIFFDPRNKDQMPALNFAYHCQEPVSREYPSLLRCRSIETAVRECQANGKKVLMSLGGASGRYGFTSKAQSIQFASTVWNLLLGGKSMQHLRPFGRVELDGVDLDIEGGSYQYYTDFTIGLRSLMKSDLSKQYTIAAAPQCPFPDAYLGPSSLKALGDVPQLFDEIYIQYYNNYCHAGNAFQFWRNLNQWLQSFANYGRPLVLIGLPADDNGASNNPANYQSPEQVEAIFERLKGNFGFGGFMLWDAGFDQYNVINGKPYSNHIVEIIEKDIGIKPSTRGIIPVKEEVVTSQPNTVTSPSKSTPLHPAKSELKELKPSFNFCMSAAEGHHPHPLDCSQFIVCFRKAIHIRSCPLGLRWNTKINTCDWAVNVPCK